MHAGRFESQADGFSRIDVHIARRLGNGEAAVGEGDVDQRAFAEALDAMADRVDVPAVRRFVDGVAIAVQRGTPLADVLRAQAGDARADLHRGLLETAGRKEVLMLVPVVFLVLPTVVLVALYPAISSLSSINP